jgi:predicted DNA-binding transcriptional regulator AlpA
MLKSSTVAAPGQIPASTAHAPTLTNRSSDWLDLRIALRIDEVVMASGLSRSSIYALIASGDLPSTKVAGRRLVLVDDLKALLMEGRS